MKISYKLSFLTLLTMFSLMTWLPVSGSDRVDFSELMSSGSDKNPGESMFLTPDIMSRLFFGLSSEIKSFIDDRKVINEKLKLLGSKLKSAFSIDQLKALFESNNIDVDLSKFPQAPSGEIFRAKSMNAVKEVAEVVKVDFDPNAKVNFNMMDKIEDFMSDSSQEIAQKVLKVPIAIKDFVVNHPYQSLLLLYCARRVIKKINSISIGSVVDVILNPVDALFDKIAERVCNKASSALLWGPKKLLDMLKRNKGSADSQAKTESNNNQKDGSRKVVHYYDNSGHLLRVEDISSSSNSGESSKSVVSSAQTFANPMMKYL